MGMQIRPGADANSKHYIPIIGMQIEPIFKIGLLREISQAKEEWWSWGHSGCNAINISIFKGREGVKNTIWFANI